MKSQKSNHSIENECCKRAFAIEVCVYVNICTGMLDKLHKLSKIYKYECDKERCLNAIISERMRLN